MADLDPEPWTLMYWRGMRGRGDYVRLLLEDAGAPYVLETNRAEGEEGEGPDPFIAYFFMGGQTEGFPARAPPCLRRGDVVVSQSAACMQLLAHEYGYEPADPVERAHATQVCLTAMDLVDEGRGAFHAKNYAASYHEQEEFCQPYIRRFAEERLPKHLAHLERVLSRSTSGFCVGESATIADFAVFHAISAAEAQFAPEWEAAEVPALKAFKARFAERPRLAAYLASERALPWEGNSMM